MNKFIKHCHQEGRDQTLNKRSIKQVSDYYKNNGFTVCAVTQISHSNLYHGKVGFDLYCENENTKEALHLKATHPFKSKKDGKFYIGRDQGLLPIFKEVPKINKNIILKWQIVLVGDPGEQINDIYESGFIPGDVIECQITPKLWQESKFSIKTESYPDRNKVNCFCYSLEMFKKSFHLANWTDIVPFFDTNSKVKSLFNIGEELKDCKLKLEKVTNKINLVTNDDTTH